MTLVRLPLFSICLICKSSLFLSHQIFSLGFKSANWDSQYAQDPRLPGTFSDYQESISSSRQTLPVLAACQIGLVSLIAALVLLNLKPSPKPLSSRLFSYLSCIMFKRAARHKARACLVFSLQPVCSCLHHFLQHVPASNMEALSPQLFWKSEAPSGNFTLCSRVCSCIITFKTGTWIALEILQAVPFWCKEILCVRFVRQLSYLWHVYSARVQRWTCIYITEVNSVLFPVV